MSRYIDAEALLKDLEEELEIDSPMLNEVENKWVNKGIRIAIKDVKRFPTADVVEVRHGEWKVPTTINGRAFNVPHCSVCDGIPCGVDENTKYCPNCGAKMDGERSTKDAT